MDINDLARNLLSDPDGCDCGDALHMIFEATPFRHWTEIADDGTTYLANLGISTEEYDPIDGMISAVAAHAYNSGIAAVAKAINVDPKSLMLACGDIFEEGAKSFGIEGLAEAVRSMDEYLRERKNRAHVKAL